MDLNKRLPILLIILIISSSLQFILLASTQSYLHHLSTCETIFSIQDTHHKTFYLFPTPAHLWLAQDYTTAVAAFTGILIASLGLVALPHQQHHQQPPPDQPHPQNPTPLFRIWTFLTIPTTFLTTGAHIFNLVLTHLTSSSTFSLASSAAIQNKPFELFQWTSETWFTVLENLQFVHEAQREEMVRRVRVMGAGRWNLVVMTVLGWAVMWIAIGLVRAGRWEVGKDIEVWKDEKDMFGRGAKYAAAVSGCRDC